MRDATSASPAVGRLLVAVMFSPSSRIALEASLKCGRIRHDRLAAFHIDRERSHLEYGVPLAANPAHAIALPERYELARAFLHVDLEILIVDLNTHGPVGIDEECRHLHLK